MRTKELPDGFRWPTWEDSHENDPDVEESGSEEEEDKDKEDKEEENENEDDEEDEEGEEEEEEEGGGEEEGGQGPPRRRWKPGPGKLVAIEPFEVISNYPATLSSEKFDKHYSEFMEKRGTPVNKRPTLGSCFLFFSFFARQSNYLLFFVSRNGAPGFQETL